MTHNSHPRVFSYSLSFLYIPFLRLHRDLSLFHFYHTFLLALHFTSLSFRFIFHSSFVSMPPLFLLSLSFLSAQLSKPYLYWLVRLSIYLLISRCVHVYFYLYVDVYVCLRLH